MNKEIAIELKNISKYFGDVAANDDISFDVKKGEILAILGENGCGKTTLMNMISGIYFPDKGQIIIDGKEVIIKSPKDAFDNKIGMVHQHFKLIDVFTGVDNVLLGIKEKYTKRDYCNEKGLSELVKFSDKFKYFFKKIGFRFKNDWLKKNRGEKIEEIINRYGFDVDLNKKIHEMSVSEKQTIEIVKTLYRGANILILDEPTAVLTPQETDKLFDVIKKMRDDGKSIIIITHKLNEVLAVSDRVVILRKGKYITTVNTSEATELGLTELMVGQKVSLNIERPLIDEKVDRLIVKDLCCNNSEGIPVLKSVSFTAQSGEILGIAGISGSGQKEILEAIAGLQYYNSGEIIYNDPKSNEMVDLKSKTPSQIREYGVRLSFVPEDRLGMGLVGNMDIVDNVMLRGYESGKSIFVNKNKPSELADKIIKELEVVTPDSHTAVRKLSGGNVQKILVGREIASNPSVLMAAYPVRGLDINSSYAIYDLLNQQKKNGASVIFVGEDLDVLVALCDRIVVLCDGCITGILDARNTTKEEVGLLMTKSQYNKKEVEEDKKND